MKQKDFPKELLINGNIWRVRFVRKIPGQDTATKECLGLCDPGQREILIKTGQAYLERLDTFYHEVFHALSFEYEFDIQHKIVHKLGETFARFCIDNF